MSRFIPFTTEQKEQAASVDLEEFLRCRGEKLIPSGREKRLASDHSVTVRGCEWFDHAAERGGNAISFVKQFYGLNYPEAVTILLDSQPGTIRPSAKSRTEEPTKPFKLPSAHSDMRRVYAYLVKRRCIDREVLTDFVRLGLVYEDAKYHNAVFVGMNEHGVPCHAHKRSTTSYGKAFRANVESSEARHSFHYLGGDDTLYVFEAPIDLLSYISLFPEDWRKHNYVACCGTSSIPVLEMIRQLQQLRQVYLCLDNDEAGHAASGRMTLLLRERGLETERLVPQEKDWNDDLIEEHEIKEEMNESCQAFC